MRPAQVTKIAREASYGVRVTTSVVYANPAKTRVAYYLIKLPREFNYREDIETIEIKCAIALALRSDSIRVNCCTGVAREIKVYFGR